MDSQKVSIVIATGGSGGHVIPSEALSNSLHSEGVNCIFMGHNVERNPFMSQKCDAKKINIPSAPISIKRLHKFIVSNLHGTLKALRILKQLKPACVVGFGSYHSFPVLLAAYMKNIPIILYEANTTMGKVVKLFSRKAHLVASPFDLFKDIPQFFHVKPLIKEVSQNENAKSCPYEYFGLAKDKKTILILGGSQGAQILNQKVLEKLTSELDEAQFQFIHLAGKNTDLKPIISFYNAKRYIACVKHFEERMFLAYSLADLVVSRSGATTLFELSHFQKKAILIPFAKSADNHQQMNAVYYLKYHQGAMIDESLLPLLDLAPLVTRLIENDENHCLNQLFSSEVELSKKVLELC